MHPHLSDVRHAVAEHLLRSGWTDQRSWGPAIASKIFETVCGPKEALILWRDFGTGVLLSGVYYSEGDNVLGSAHLIFDLTTPVEQVPALVDRHLTEVHERIDRSYARRLFLA